MQTPVAWILKEKGHVVHTIGRNASVFQAVKQMEEHAVGSLVVMEGSEVVGIVAERDILMQCVAAGKDARRTAVVEVMNDQPNIIPSTSTVAMAMALMTGRRARHLPVVDDGRLQGLVSIGDITQWLTRHLEGEVQNLEKYIRGAYA